MSPSTTAPLVTSSAGVAAETPSLSMIVPVPVEVPSAAPPPVTPAMTTETVSSGSTTESASTEMLIEVCTEPAGMVTVLGDAALPSAV